MPVILSGLSRCPGFEGKISSVLLEMQSETLRAVLMSDSGGVSPKLFSGEMSEHFESIFRPLLSDDATMVNLFQQRAKQLDSDADRRSGFLELVLRMGKNLNAPSSGAVLKAIELGFPLVDEVKTKVVADVIELIESNEDIVAEVKHLVEHCGDEAELISALDEQSGGTLTGLRNLPQAEFYDLLKKMEDEVTFAQFEKLYGIFPELLSFNPSRTFKVPNSTLEKLFLNAKVANHLPDETLARVRVYSKNRTFIKAYDKMLRQRRNEASEQSIQPKHVLIFVMFVIGLSLLATQCL